MKKSIELDCHGCYYILAMTVTIYVHRKGGMDIILQSSRRRCIVSHLPQSSRGRDEVSTVVIHDNCYNLFVKVFLDCHINLRFIRNDKSLELDWHGCYRIPTMTILLFLSVLNIAVRSLSNYL